MTRILAFVLTISALPAQAMRLDDVKPLVIKTVETLSLMQLRDNMIFVDYQYKEIKRLASAQQFPLLVQQLDKQTRQELGIAFKTYMNGPELAGVDKTLKQRLDKACQKAFGSKFVSGGEVRELNRFGHATVSVLCSVR